MTGVLVKFLYCQSHETKTPKLTYVLQVADDSAMTELTAPVSGVILTLMANLRQCFMSEDPGAGERRDSQYITMLDKTQGASTSVSWGQGSGSRTLFATSLQMVLKGLIEHILRSSRFN